MELTQMVTLPVFAETLDPTAVIKTAVIEVHAEDVRKFKRRSRFFRQFHDDLKLALARPRPSVPS